MHHFRMRAAGNDTTTRARFAIVGTFHEFELMQVKSIVPRPCGKAGPASAIVPSTSANTLLMFNGTCIRLRVVARTKGLSRKCSSCASYPCGLNLGQQPVVLTDLSQAGRALVCMAITPWCIGLMAAIGAAHRLDSAHGVAPRNRRRSECFSGRTDHRQNRLAVGARWSRRQQPNSPIRYRAELTLPDYRSTRQGQRRSKHKPSSAY
jgi:hypothetical protein